MPERRRADMLHWFAYQPEGVLKPIRMPCSAALTLAYDLTGDPLYALAHRPGGGRIPRAGGGRTPGSGRPSSRERVRAPAESCGLCPRR